MTKLFTFLFLLVSIFQIHGQSISVDFEAAPRTVCEGEAVTFTASATSNSPITSYVWDFGDGFKGNGQTVTHIFNTSGTKNIMLTGVNSLGGTDFELKQAYITVKPTPFVDFSISGIGCNVPLTLNYTNKSAVGANYFWDFSNGQTSTAETPPAQTYDIIGTYKTILTVTLNNCVAKDTQEVVVSNFQTAINIPSVACAGQPVNFEDNSTAGANSWDWSFGGLGNSNQKNPTFTFNSAGTYSILLSSRNTTSGCNGNASKEIIIESSPKPSFTADLTKNCAPAVVNFTNNSTGGNIFTWNFGDGQTFVGTNPSPHTYFVNGNYDVKLSMVSQNGCVGDTIIDDFIKITDVEALFNSDVIGGCNPLSINFSDSSITPNQLNPIISWNWDFGNGKTYNGQNPPTQIYNNNGVFEVSLAVKTQTGCTGKITKEKYVTVGQINNLNLSVDKVVNCIKKDFKFISNVITTPVVVDSTELNYFWDFTDGTSKDRNPTYKFTSDTGYFDVKLVVDFRGCKDSVQIDSLIYINAPIAKFTADKSLFCNSAPPVTPSFSDDAKHGKKSDDLLMIWRWGDGTPNVIFDDPQLDDSNAGDTSHRFTNYGSYTVKQVIFNYTTGCEDSTTRTIDVSKITANFEMSNDSICPQDTLLLNDKSSTWLEPPTPHKLSSWSFNMGDGSVLSGKSVGYSYNLPDIFNVKTFPIILTVKNSVGCSATTTQQVKVLPNPFPVINVDRDSICLNDSILFTNNSSPMPGGLPISYYEFNFYDDTLITSSKNSFHHTFTINGSYFTEVTVTDVFGCRAKQLIPVNIIKPKSFFTVDNVICNNDKVFTTNVSEGISPLTFQWFVDSIPVSTNLNVDTVFKETNISSNETNRKHSISLITKDGFGCLDTILNPVTVSIPWAIPSYSFTGAGIGPNGKYVCPPLFGSYKDKSISFGQITNWKWDFGDGDQSVNKNPENSYGLPGTYDLILEVTDSYGCKADTVIEKYVSIGGPSGKPSWLQQAGKCVQGAQFVLNDPILVDSLFWTMGNNQTVRDSLQFFYNYPIPGTYTPGVYLYDTLGCKVFYSLTPVTVLDDGLDASLSASPNGANPEQTILFTDNSSAQTSTIVSWEWDFGDDEITSLTNASQSYAYSNSGKYNVVLTVTDDMFCQASDTLIITIFDLEIWLPNVITTNNDGINELFVLPFDAFKNYKVTILNRWGNVMRIGERDPNNPLFLWDGIDQSGKICSDGVYFYRIQGELFGGKLIDKQGFVTVIESK
jgi:PKD repeat protein